jgi:hypothetical protein
MLSYKRGTPICKIIGGKQDGEIIRIFDPSRKCCAKCTDKCKTAKKQCCKECAILKGGCMSCSVDDYKSDIEPFDKLNLLPPNYFQKKGGRINLVQLEKLKRAITKQQEPLDDEVGILYKEASKDLNNLSKYMIKLHDGLLQPLPSEDDNVADHVFITAPTGAGKSTFMGAYSNEIKKLFPDKDVYIFSSFDEDKPLDKLDPTRIDLEDPEFLEEPINKKELSNSICIFDDIDTLPKEVSKVAQALRNDLLQCGRKEGIRVLASSHQIMNYRQTRDLLNSCQKIVIFPGDTIHHHKMRFLREYCGLDKKCAQFLLKIPTRWLLINKTSPMHCIHEHGVVLLNKLDEVVKHIDEDKRVGTNVKRKKRVREQEDE